MVSLMDFLALIEQSRRSLTPTGQERLEQMAYSKQKVRKVHKVEKEAAGKQAEQADTMPSCACETTTA